MAVSAYPLGAPRIRSVSDRAVHQQAPGRYRPNLIATPAPAPDAEDWYANLLWFSGRKCLLLTHSATLFSIFEADLRAADLRATGRLAARLIAREVRSKGLPSSTFADPEPEKGNPCQVRRPQCSWVHERHGVPVRERS